MTGFSRSQPRMDTVAVLRANNPPDGGRQVEPAGGQDPQEMAVREDQDIAVRGADPGEHAVGPCADLFDGLAVRPRPGPDRPARVVVADVRGQATLECAVVPFPQVRVDDRGLTEARQLCRFRRARHRAGEDEPEGGAGQPPAEGERLFATGLGQRDVGAAGVTAKTRPFGLAVADEPRVLLGFGGRGRSGS